MENVKFKQKVRRKLSQTTEKKELLTQLIQVFKVLSIDLYVYRH